RTRSLRAQRHALELQVRERTARLSEANARLLDLSYRDALTGLANRRSLLEALESGGGAAALLFLDVDHFKDYNDRLGHPAGDEALRAVGQVLLAAAPPAALVARYGGEEFACLLPGLDAAAARDLAERIRRAVAQRDVPIPGSDALGRVTVSIGVAAGDLDGDAAAHRLLREADAALYRAKNEGRDCVRG
ncbi:MAG TPA: GGDEF domain-containing protein, partial [Rhodanobacteraceae bacterium]|nr:GGDEF domain-containing protein [Rhodanobacteraceae bacterium]